MHRDLKLRLSVAALITYMATIFYLSSLNQVTIESTGLTPSMNLSSALHFILYAGLSFNMAYVLKKKNTHSMFAVLGSTLYGVSDELHQYFVPTRCCNLADMGINALGSLVGVLLFLLVYAAHRKLRTRKPLSPTSGEKKEKHRNG